MRKYSSLLFSLLMIKLNVLRAIFIIIARRENYEI